MPRPRNARRRRRRKPKLADTVLEDPLPYVFVGRDVAEEAFEIGRRGPSPTLVQLRNGAEHCKELWPLRPEFGGRLDRLRIVDAVVMIAALADRTDMNTLGRERVGRIDQARKI